MNLDFLNDVLGNIFILQYLIFLVVAVIGILAIIFLIEMRKPCKANILRKQGNSYVKIKTIKFGRAVKTIRYKGKTFYVDLSNVAYVNANNPILFFDYDTGETLSFLKNEGKLTPEELDLFVSQKIISQLSTKLGEFGMDKFLITLLVIVFLALGFFIGMFAYPYINKSLPTNSTNVKVMLTCISELLIN